MDSYRKVLVGTALVSLAVIAAVVTVAYGTGGRFYSEASARQEVDDLEDLLLDLKRRSATERFNALVAFVEHTNARLDAFDQIHRFGHDSEVYRLYQEKVQALIDKYFPEGS